MSYSITLFGIRKVSIASLDIFPPHPPNYRYQIPLYLPLRKGEAYVSPFEKGGLRGISVHRGLTLKDGYRGQRALVVAGSHHRLNLFPDLIRGFAGKQIAVKLVVTQAHLIFIRLAFP